jgi:hypothetical protein
MGVCQACPDTENISYFVSLFQVFRRVHKITNSDYRLRRVLSARPSVRMERLGSRWTDFDETRYLSFFRKSVKKIQGSLKSGKNNEYFT